MDKKTLVTVAITAAVTIMSTELTKWLLSVAKIAIVSDATKQKAKTILSRSNLKIVWSAVWLVWMICLTIYLVRKQGPVTRGDVLGIALCVVGCVFSFIQLLWDIILSRRRRTPGI